MPGDQYSSIAKIPVSVGASADPTLKIDCGCRGACPATCTLSPQRPAAHYTCRLEVEMRERSRMKVSEDDLAVQPRFIHYTFYTLNLGHSPLPNTTATTTLSLQHHHHHYEGRFSSSASINLFHLL